MVSGAQANCREVSDALVGYRKSQEVRIQQQQLTHSAQEATLLSSMRYKGGAASYLEVLDSDTRYFSAQLSLAQARLRELQSLVQIYRSLGGGWHERQDAGREGERSRHSDRADLFVGHSFISALSPVPFVFFYILLLRAMGTKVARR